MFNNHFLGNFGDIVAHAAMEQAEERIFSYCERVRLLVRRVKHIIFPGKQNTLPFEGFLSAYIEAYSIALDYNSFLDRTPEIIARLASVPYLHVGV
jgi:hypothetical protein